VKNHYKYLARTPPAQRNIRNLPNNSRNAGKWVLNPMVPSPKRETVATTVGPIPILAANQCGRPSKLQKRMLQMPTTKNMAKIPQVWPKINTWSTNAGNAKITTNV
jgi:hypothetical protein